MASNKGNCYICGKNMGKTAMKNHLLKEHGEGDEKCYLLKAEGAYNRSYWLFFTVPVNEKLLEVDSFLRQIWCECCGHMSAFEIGKGKDKWFDFGDCDYGMSEKLSSFRIGSVLPYEYDFGTTTYINVTIVGEIYRPKQKDKICLLARNEPPSEVCCKCGKPAVFVNAGSWDHECYCKRCSNGQDEFMLSPITNSPRCGACGYEGGRDRWTFDPKKIKTKPVAAQPKEAAPPKAKPAAKASGKEKIAGKANEEEILATNKTLVADFEKYLNSTNLSQKTINTHADNVDFYVNDYLCYSDAREIALGCYAISSFMDDWFPRKAAWASCAQIKSMAASIKKFYKYLLERKAIEPADYAMLALTIKEETDDWLKSMKKYERELFGW
jgi:hypothetical protein